MNNKQQIKENLLEISELEYLLQGQISELTESSGIAQLLNSGQALKTQGLNMMALMSLAPKLEKYAAHLPAVREIVSNGARLIALQSKTLQLLALEVVINE